MKIIARLTFTLIKKKKKVQDFPGGAANRKYLPKPGTWVRSLVQENATCHGAAEPLHHSCGAGALGPSSHISNEPLGHSS